MFWIVIPLIFLGFFLLRVFVWGPRWGYGWYACDPYAYGPPVAYMDAREELRQRLARGDITPEEYEKRRDALTR